MEVEYDYSPDKNARLKAERGISFEEIILLIDEGHLLDVLEHPNQRIYVVDVDGYVYLVPFVRTGDRIFLKTIYPSRRPTKTYRERKEGRQ